MSPEFVVKANYSKEEDCFNLKMGTLNIQMTPIQFGRMIEYLDTVWSSYSTWRKNK